MQHLLAGEFRRPQKADPEERLALQTEARQAREAALVVLPI